MIFLIMQDVLHQSAGANLWSPVVLCQSTVDSVRNREPVEKWLNARIYGDHREKPIQERTLRFFRIATMMNSLPIVQKRVLQ